MNLILLHPEDFVRDDKVTLTGRRLTHVRDVHRAVVGQTLRVGRLDGLTGRGIVTAISGEHLDLEIELRDQPPPPLPLTLILALPRPKVLNRIVASVTSLGVKKLFVINSWRVEKSYWKSPRLSPENLLEQRMLGLEQAGDTTLPSVELRRFFTPFVRDELPVVAEGTRRLIAHPYDAAACPMNLGEPVTLVVGPEGGFIEDEVRALREHGFEAVTIGARILRVETVLPYLISRLFPG